MFNLLEVLLQLLTHHRVPFEKVNRVLDLEKGNSLEHKSVFLAVRVVQLLLPQYKLYLLQIQVVVPECIEVLEVLPLYKRRKSVLMKFMDFIQLWYHQQEGSLILFFKTLTDEIETLVEKWRTAMFGSFKPIFSTDEFFQL